MNFRIKKKNYATDPLIGFLTESILQPFRLQVPSDNVEVKFRAKIFLYNEYQFFRPE